ncbi:MAG: nitroreductase family protein [Candidatus Eutrophobiaceae bacterium]
MRIKKRAQSQSAIHDLVAERWSPRVFDESRDLTSAEILALMEAAHWAPSCYGAQPWIMILCQRSAVPDAWDKLLTCLSPGNQSWARHVPLLIAVFSDTLFSHNDQANRWHAYDTGAASENLCLQAVAMDFAVHQMGGFDAKLLSREFSVPERYVPMAVLAVGKQLDEDKVPEELLERESQARQRAPLALHFRLGSWDRAYGDDE